MAVKIRLTRMGKKKQPSYRVVVMDSRKPRDGAYIEQIGRYDPRQDPSIVEIDNDRALDWLNKGAQPTERAQKLLEISGAWTRFRVSKGDIHTIEAKPEPVAAVEEPAEAPAEDLAEVVAEAPAVEAAEAVAETPAEELAEAVAEAPAVEAAEAVAESPAEELAEAVAEVPAVEEAAEAPEASEETT